MSDYTRKSSIQLLKHFVGLYPMRALIVIVALLMAGVVETIGIGALLPLLNIVLGNTEAQESNTLTWVIDSVFSFFGLNQSFDNLLFLIVLAIAFKAFVIFQALKVVAYVSVDITYDLRRQFINALMVARWNYYTSLDPGKSANAIATEADYAGHFCTIMGKTVSSALQAGIYALIAFVIDWKISLAAIVMGSIFAFLLRFLVRMARDAGNEMAITLNSLLSSLSESLAGAKPIKAMGEEKQYSHLLNADTIGLQNCRKRLAFSSLLLTHLHEPMLVSLMALGLWWAYGFAQYPITELFMMAFLFNRLLNQVNLVQNNYQKTSVFEGAVNSILEKIQVASEQQEQSFGTADPNLQKEINLKNLKLGYEDKIILDNFSAKISAGKMTAIFGPSGSGKSTILDAALGLIIPKSGNVFIDENDLNDVDIRKWRKMIGYVPQDTFLFHDTVYKNITLGDKSISQERVINALKVANAWEFISQTDGGIYHVVGERGGKLSGGQRQRLALARALVREPALLIMDEATTGLDEENERIILEALKNMLPDVTIILISHDPKILDIADHVINLKNDNVS